MTTAMREVPLHLIEVPRGHEIQGGFVALRLDTEESVIVQAVLERTAVCHPIGSFGTAEDRFVIKKKLLLVDPGQIRFRKPSFTFGWNGQRRVRRDDD